MKLLKLAWVAVAAAWSISEGEVAVAAPGDAAEREKISVVRTRGFVTLPIDRSLDIAFKVPEAPPKPHQAMVRIFSPELNDERLFPAKFRGKGAKVAIPHRSIPWEFRGEPLEVSIVVGSKEGQGVEEPAFGLLVDHDEHSKVVLTRKRDKLNTLGPNPEIDHLFREEPRRTNAVIALVFVGAVVVLLGALLTSWQSTGLLPKSISIHVALFSATVIAVEAMFVGYFVSWSIFTVLSLGAVLGPLLLWTGKRI